MKNSILLAAYLCSFLAVQTVVAQNPITCVSSQIHCNTTKTKEATTLFESKNLKSVKVLNASIIHLSDSPPQRIIDQIETKTQKTDRNSSISKIQRLSQASYNLTPYQPSAWDDKIVLSTISGTNISPSTIYDNQTIYLDFAVVNNGSNDITQTFYFYLYIDGILKSTYKTDGLLAAYYTYMTDVEISPLTAGTHTFKIVTDATNTIAETNETDNEYTITKTIVGKPAQDIQISFAGIGASTMIDSVKVVNVTQGTTMTIGGTDVLHLPAVNTGINSVPNATDNALLIYPNPMTESSIIEFQASSSGIATIELFDIAGKKVNGIQNTVTTGDNRYKISGLYRGLYLVKINSKGYSYSGKLVSTNITNSALKITYESSSLNSFRKVKSAKKVAAISYNSGDLMLFYGTSGIFITIVAIIPTQSMTITFNFVACTDADGNNYPVVQIGPQIWMAENLNTTKYRNGDPIPNVTDNAAWAGLSTGAFCNNNNNVTDAAIYGRLYNFYAARDSRNIAPSGWHLPTKAEWDELTASIGGAIAGGKLKETGTTHWKYPNTGATNETGFTALPGNSRDYDGRFGILSAGIWWSSGKPANDTLWTFGITNEYRLIVPVSYLYKQIGVSVRCVKDYSTDTSIQTALIPAGTFTMGSPTTEVKSTYSGDETQHSVTLTAFRISKYEITNAQYAAFLNAKSIGSNGLYVAGAFPTNALIYATSYYEYALHYNGSQWVSLAGYENSPVISVPWYGATEFATYVGGTLPTEAQWEYACRAGTTTPFNTGDFLSNLQANYYWAKPYNGGTNTVTTYPGKTHPIGTYAPNAYGLYDMHGNVSEWCSDWYGSYPTSAQTNPTGVTNGTFRVVRGGFWSEIAVDCRSAFRGNDYPASNNPFYGFRVVFVP